MFLDNFETNMILFRSTRSNVVAKKPAGIRACRWHWSITQSLVIPRLSIPPIKPGSYLRQVYRKWKDPRSLIASTFMLRHSSRTHGGHGERGHANTYRKRYYDEIARYLFLFHSFLPLPVYRFSIERERFERYFNISDTSGR